MPDISDLRQRQALPLNAKVSMSQNRIREWYQHWDGDVYISFSGGKDSTVLAHLVRDLYPDVPLIFCNTGLEYPEVQSFAREVGAEFITPTLRFSDVISKYGYPVISKEVAGSIYEARPIRSEISFRKQEFLGKRINQKTGELCPYQKTKYYPLCVQTQFKISATCCTAMKKNPIRSYERRTGRKPFIGTLTDESKLREQSWLKHGCNAFDKKKPSSHPMSFWKENDVLRYIVDNGLKIASVYGEIVSVDKDGYQYEAIGGVGCSLKCSGCQRTGCIFCGFGSHRDTDEVTRWQRLAITHPKQYEYCIGGGQWVDNPDFDESAPKFTGDWENWNPKKIWVPSKKGLGMGKVFDDINSLYGKDFIRYK